MWVVLLPIRPAKAQELYFKPTATMCCLSPDLNDLNDLMSGFLSLFGFGACTARGRCTPSWMAVACMVTQHQGSAPRLSSYTNVISTAGLVQPYCCKPARSLNIQVL